MKRSTTPYAFLALLVLTGCGYLYSGKWEDDPKNWQRAWSTSKPSDVVMSHSWYWRGAHWSREEAYFFQFQWHQSLFDSLVTENQMQRQKDAATVPRDYCFGKPGWFVPKHASDYEVWRCSPPEDCWLYRDKSTREIFLYACQI